MGFRVLGFCGFRVRVVGFGASWVLRFRFQSPTLPPAPKPCAIRIFPASQHPSSDRKQTHAAPARLAKPTLDLGRSLP